MSAIPSIQVTHESEVQRQHVRLALPARAFLEGKEYEVKDISCGGIALRNVKGSFPKGKNLLLDVRFVFDGFSFDIRLNAEVRYYAADKNILGFRFTGLTPQQVSLLSQIIKSYIAGDIITAGSILNIAARNSMAKPRASANRNAPPPGIWKQLPGLAAVAILGLLIITVIAQNLYSSIFVVRSDTATVTGPAVALRAQAAGIFRSQIEPDLAFVRQNQPLGTVTSAAGSAVSITSPCNCYIAKTEAASGELVAQGQKILSLMPVEARPWIIADIDPAAGKRLGSQTTATVSVFGSRNQYTGRVASVESATGGATPGAARTATAKIILDQKLPVDFVGRLAAVTFNIR
ncbi:MAG: PilZ domain-containing protein [Alphaproteobacteria bacterium]